MTPTCPILERPETVTNMNLKKHFFLKDYRFTANLVDFEIDESLFVFANRLVFHTQ